MLETSLEFWLMGLGTLLYFVTVWAPFVFAVFVAIRRRQTMHRRLLFVGTVPVLVYGVLCLGILVFVIPVEMFLIFFLPELKERGYIGESFFLRIADFVHQYGLLLLPFVIAIVALLVVRYLSPRWNAIVQALTKA